MSVRQNALYGIHRYEWIDKEVEADQTKAAPVPNNLQLHVPRPCTVVELKKGCPRTSDGPIPYLDNSSRVYNRLYPEEYKFGEFVTRNNEEIVEVAFIRAATDSLSFDTVQESSRRNQSAECFR